MRVAARFISLPIAMGRAGVGCAFVVLLPSPCLERGWG